MSNPTRMADASNASSLLQEPDFVQQLLQIAETEGRSPQQAQDYARKCLKEIAATPRESWLRPAAAIARFIYTRSYEKELDINSEALKQLKALGDDQLMLFLWSHKSHMDSFVFLLSLYDNGYRPLPLVFAGINMNFFGFGALARRVGAIFLRRSFQDDPIYKLVFKRYIRYLIRNRIPLTWSIEGTRSRTGKLSPPKLGILNWVLEACHEENMLDASFVPVAIAFDRIAEIDDYVAIQQGQPKRKESLKWFMDFIFGMKQPYGKIYVRYAEPVALADAPALFAPRSQADGAPSEATRLAFEVSARIEQVTPIKSADVLSMVLLGANGRALQLQEVASQAAEIVALIEENGLPRATGFSLANSEEVGAALLALENANLATCFDKGISPVYYIPEASRLAAAYYSNSITHYFLAAALGEVGLASCALDISRPEQDLLRRKVDALRDLYKFEFFFKPRDAFWKDVLAETVKHYPDWDRGQTSLQKQLRNSPPRFGHSILRAFTEAYLVLATSLEALGEAPVDDQKAFKRRLLDEGRRMLLRHTVSGESSVSQDLFATGLRLAENRELLAGEGEALARRRVDFRMQVEEALRAINLLQACYNSAWFGEAGGAAARLSSRGSGARAAAQQ